LDEHGAESLGDEFFREWENEVARCRLKGDSSRNPSALRVIGRVFGWQLIVSGIVIAILELGTR